MKKTAGELKKELEEAIRKEKQLTNYMKRLENRKKFMEQGERKKRTHHLCNIGGAIESVFPDTMQLSKVEFYSLMEQLSAMPEVNTAIQRAVSQHQSSNENGGI